MCTCSVLQILKVYLKKKTVLANNIIVVKNNFKIQPNLCSCIRELNAHWLVKVGVSMTSAERIQTREMLKDER